MIILQVIDKKWKIIKEIGGVEDMKLHNFTKQCNQKNLKCLSFVDFVGDTYFNEKQIREILKEIEVLQEDKQVNQEIVEIIQRGCLEALKGFNYYLKFEGE